MSTGTSEGAQRIDSSMLFACVTFLYMFLHLAHFTSCDISPSRSDDHSMMGEPEEGVRPRSWEVYAGMPGIDSLFSGLSKRTPTGGFFTS